MIGIREFNKKITSLKNTKKMTKTMKMVSASKFKRAYRAQSEALAYANELTGLMQRLAVKGTEFNHPLVQKSKKIQNALVLLVTSDKGLCGGFNNNLIRYARGWIAAHREKFKVVDFSFCGRRGYMALRRSVSVSTHYEDVTLKPSYADAAKIVDDLSRAFIGQKYDEIYIAYNHFRNPLSQVPVIEQLIPLDVGAFAKTSVSQLSPDHIFEPKVPKLMGLLIPKVLNFKIFYSLLENSAGEHGSRMTAMDKATDNTGELIDRYTLLRNRARQMAITTELIEIVSGAEALNN